MRRGPLSALLWVVILVPFCSVLPAEESGNSASIEIDVTDQSGAVVPNAKVLILPLPNEGGKILSTDSAGKLELDLAPGNYLLRMQVPGFRRARRPIEVKPGTHQFISIVLEVKSCSPCVMVTTMPLGFPLPPEPPSFPALTEVPSLDGRYVLVSKGRAFSHHHTVFLEDHHLKTRRRLFEFNDRVVLLWNEDSTLLAVTDYETRGSSRCTIYSVDKKFPPFPAMDLILSGLTEPERQSLEKFLSKERVLEEAIRWNDNGWGGYEWGSLIVQVTRYGATGTKDFCWEFPARLQPEHNPPY
jgi:hypothetical protein